MDERKDGRTYLIIGGLHEPRDERRVAERRAFLVEAYLVTSVNARQCSFVFKFSSCGRVRVQSTFSPCVNDVRGGGNE